MRHLESSLQRQIVEYCELMGIYCFHVKNEGHKRIQTALRDKAEGVKPGVTDLIFPCKDGITRYMEIKSAKGTLSDKQKDFRDMCKLSAIPWAMCRSLDEAIVIFRQWGIMA